jgi:HNH endonuclease/AP2 domain
MKKIADLIYDPKTGRFWREAGCANRSGYRSIWFNGRHCMEHRVAWFIHYGEWPADHVDHINGVKSDNRIKNLRLATASENSRNRSKPRNNVSGHKGVSWIKKYQSWQATIKFDGKNKFLGRFATREEAAAVYHKAALQYHGEFAKIDL